MHDSELIEERLRPVAERIAQIPGETLAPEKYRNFFAGCASFLTEVLPIVEEQMPGQGMSLAQLED